MLSKIEARILVVHAIVLCSLISIIGIKLNLMNCSFARINFPSAWQVVFAGKYRASAMRSPQNAEEKCTESDGRCSVFDAQTRGSRLVRGGWRCVHSTGRSSPSRSLCRHAPSTWPRTPSGASTIARWPEGLHPRGRGGWDVHPSSSNPRVIGG